MRLWLSVSLLDIAHFPNFPHNVGLWRANYAISLSMFLLAMCRF
jgi:hypothetical protein